MSETRIKLPFINYTNCKEEPCECDNCDEIKQCVHFNLIRNAYILCEDCVNELLNQFKEE